MGVERGNNQRYAAVCACVIFSKETCCEGYAKVVVEETCKEDIHLVVAEGFLLCPARIVLCEPEKVVVM